MATEPSIQLERALVVAGSAAWLLAACGGLGLLPLAGTLDIGLYRLYSFAGLLGWLSGNVYVLRRRGLPQERTDARPWQKRLLLTYFLAPAGFIYLTRALASGSVQRAAPLVPIYGLIVYLIFFLVPVTLKNSRA